MKSAALGLVAIVCLQATACSASGGPEEFYVVVSPTGAEQYYRDMIGLVAEHGMEPNPGTAYDRRGYTLYVVEGTGRGVRVWSANLLMGERESVACGGPQFAHSDPTQFGVTIWRRNPFRENQMPAVAAELKSGLQAKGYEVREEPRICSRAAGTAGP